MYQTEVQVNILIIDDTPQHIKIASSILKPFGYRILAANNGFNALSIIERQKPTLILLDIEMSEMSGFELCTTLKSNPAYEDIAIIFMTVSNDEASIRQGFALGAQDYVVKPYNASELIARVNAHVKITVQSNALKASYNELDQFCHSVSHDLKSPLQVIKQLTFLLETETSNTLTKDGKEIITRLNQKSDQLLLMIDRLLDFSRSCHMECHFQKLSLEPIFSETLKEMLSLEPAERIVHLSMPPLPIIYGDEALLKLLVQNIIGNALKFSRHQQETLITISSKINVNNVEITIQDNGCGFDMKYADKLFHIFQRLHNSHQYSGSGIGLVIMERIMQRHQGSISIYGEVDAGACVTLTFPLRISYFLQQRE